jgi:hypothetical protein
MKADYEKLTAVVKASGGKALQALFTSPRLLLPAGRCRSRRLRVRGTLHAVGIIRGEIPSSSPRIAVLTASPARIAEYFPIDLPFPRAPPIKTTDEFGAYAQRIYASLGLGSAT